MDHSEGGRSAEGVELAEHAQILDDFGCTQLQGYWIAKPLPGDDFISFVTGGSKQG